MMCRDLAHRFGCAFRYRPLRVLSGWRRSTIRPSPMRRSMPPSVPVPPRCSAPASRSSPTPCSRTPRNARRSPRLPAKQMFLSPASGSKRRLKPSRADFGPHGGCIGCRCDGRGGAGADGRGRPRRLASPRCDRQVREDCRDGAYPAGRPSRLISDRSRRTRCRVSLESR